MWSPEPSQEWEYFLAGESGGLQESTREFLLPPLLSPSEWTRTGSVPRCLHQDSFYITTLFSNWFLSLPIGKVLTVFLHIQNAIPRIRIPRHEASSWCINYFLPDMKQVWMVCAHLLSQGHITPNSEPWDTMTIGDHLGKKGKEKNKVSGKKE